MNCRTVALLLGACTVALCFGHEALAQTSAFGPKQSAPPPSGFTGWILAEQAKFYKSLATSVKAAKADGTAAFGLIWLSFLYGIFHAAGPGHGKAVISSYLIADGSTIPRGIALSAISALIQAITAIAVVGVFAVLLGATSRAMGEAVRWLEIGAYALIVAFGLWLAWRKGKAFFGAFSKKDHAHHHDHAHDHHHGHDHHHHDHGHAHHVHDEHCGHSHGPEPSELKGDNWLKRGLAAVFAVGLRPCSGAILVLAFALSQGIFYVGVLATLAMAAGTAITVAAIAIFAVGARGIAKRFAASKSGPGIVLLHGVEFAAALAIVAFGGLLITGMMASERMFPV
jgi:nickel/cobalt transporter (NicO) family protein